MSSYPARHVASEPRVWPDDVLVTRLDGPPDIGFDCGRAEQNAFLYDWAQVDQEARLSVTYLYYVQGILGAYASVSMDSVPLDRSERGSEERFQEVSALKLVQLGVALPFQGMGLGTKVVADVVVLARDVAQRVGCRYVTLDAQGDVVPWYERLTFKRNQLKQSRRVDDARAHGRHPDGIAVSMRYNLL